jgi:hypothetical protein
VARNVAKTARVRSNLGILWDLRVTCDHCERLVIVEITAEASGGKAWVIDENGISSNHDRSVFGAIVVHLLPR